jgi:phosphopantetheinyl transferase
MPKSLIELWLACGISPLKCSEDVDIGQILVYVLPLNCGSMKRIWPFLSKDEITRAISYGREIDGVRFAASRALLKGLLGNHTGINPNKLIIRYGSLGRPHLIPEQAKGLDFSLAHRGDCCVIALGFGHRVGIDIESCGSATFVESVLPMLPEEDRVVIDISHGLSRIRKLITAWTALEARAKAIGVGLDDMVLNNGPLKCQHFELGHEWIGCVAAEDFKWQMKLTQLGFTQLNCRIIEPKTYL